MNSARSSNGCERRGLLVGVEPLALARQFLWMLIGDPLDAALLGSGATDGAGANVGAAGGATRAGRTRRRAPSPAMTSSNEATCSLLADAPSSAPSAVGRASRRSAAGPPHWWRAPTVTSSAMWSAKSSSTGSPVRSSRSQIGPTTASMIEVGVSGGRQFTAVHRSLDDRCRGAQAMHPERVDDLGELVGGCGRSDDRPRPACTAGGADVGGHLAGKHPEVAEQGSGVGSGHVLRRLQPGGVGDQLRFGGPTSVHRRLVDARPCGNIVDAELVVANLSEQRRGRIEHG